MVEKATCAVKFSKTESLSILLFLSYHADEINQNKTFSVVKDAKKKLQKQLGSLITDEDFAEFHRTTEIYSIFGK